MDLDNFRAFRGTIEVAKSEFEKVALENNNPFLLTKKYQELFQKLADTSGAIPENKRRKKKVPGS
jgi:hypothetical protein